jgi:hypothetical protein
VVTPTVRSYKAIIGRAADAVGSPLLQRVIVWWCPPAVVLEPAVSVAHRGFGIHYSSVAPSFTERRFAAIPSSAR